MAAAVDQSRRALLLGRPGRSAVLRPPWALGEDLFPARCTRCDACVSACETGVIVRGSGGYPEVDFTRGECTFCEACVDACPEPVFLDPRQHAPWQAKAAAGKGCLAHDGIYCRSCGESCESGAIRFSFNAHRVPEPRIESGDCTGCGACVAVCPSRAITVDPGNEEESRG